MGENGVCKRTEFYLFLFLGQKRFNARYKNYPLLSVLICFPGGTGCISDKSFYLKNGATAGSLKSPLTLVKW